MTAAIISGGCDDMFDQMGLTVYSDYQEFTYTLMPAYAGEYEIGKTFSAINTDSIASTLDSGFVRDIKLCDAAIEIISIDSTQNFDAFESLEAVISADAFPEVVVGIIPEVPDSATKLVFNLTDENILEYMGGYEYVLKIRGMLEGNLETSMDIAVRFRFKIGIGM